MQVTNRRPVPVRFAVVATVIAFAVGAALWTLGASGTLPRQISMNIVWVPFVIQIFFLLEREKGRSPRAALTNIGKKFAPQR